jgi:hypothetical protein
MYRSIKKNYNSQPAIMKMESKLLSTLYTRSVSYIIVDIDNVQ